MSKLFTSLVMIVCSAVFLVSCSGDNGSVGGTGPAGRGSYLTAQALKIEIQSARIASDGKVTATFRITDQNGLPLDRTGLYTEGTVTAAFVLSWLDQDSPGVPRQYTAYTTTTVTTPVTAVQPAPDKNGTFTEVGAANGTYTYVFTTAIPSSHLDRTHTVAAYATRAFNGKTYAANTTYDFVPAGGAVATTREIVLRDSCNACHGDLRAHTAARDTKLCVTCHTPQAVDPDSGNTVDFPVLVHKIHRGRELPSVAAGTPYRIIGDQAVVKDFSSVGYPRELENCGSCHTGAQGDRWKTRPTRVACGSCHDLTSFESVVSAPMTSHGGGPQTDDAQCGTCHQPAGGLSGITDRHLTPLTDPASPVLAFEIQNMTNTAPGQTPTLTFRATVNGAPSNIQATPLTSLRATIAGPTTDYAAYWQATIQGSGASGVLAAVDAANGVFAYTFPAAAAIPLPAIGNYAVSMEGYLQSAPIAPRFLATSPVSFFVVTGSTLAARRTVVSDAACDACHGALSYHSSRRGVQGCLLCHNPNMMNSQRVARFESSTIVAQSMDLKVLVHKIHRGVALTQPYVIGGNPSPSKANPGGTPIDFGATRYSRDLRSCDACHLPGTYDLPLGPDRLPSIEQTLSCGEDPVADADSYCDNPWTVSATAQMPPTAAACLSCHDAPENAAHAAVNTTGTGVESCAVCHKTGAVYGLDRYHALEP